MTSTRPLPTHARSAPIPTKLRAIKTAIPQPGSEVNDRQRLLDAANRLHEAARRSAEAGDINAAAQSILQALDHERRAGVLGPQVLQLIKPR